MRSRLALAAGATLLLALTACAGASGSAGTVSHVTVHDSDNLHGVVLAKPYVVHAASLEDTAGKPYDLAARATKPLTLVFFGYTHCPDVCQVVMADIASALTRLDDAQRAQVGMVFVTTDPARDTAPVLREYLGRFDPAFEGLTGDLPTIERLGSGLAVEIEKGEKLASGGYDVTHGTQVLGVVPGPGRRTSGPRAPTPRTSRTTSRPSSTAR